MMENLHFTQQKKPNDTSSGQKYWGFTATIWWDSISAQHMCRTLPRGNTTTELQFRPQATRVHKKDPKVNSGQKVQI